MISGIFHTIVYNPIYNALVFFVDVLPNHDIGIAVIIVTIIVRIILFPLARRAIQSQIDMKRIAPEVEAIKKKYKDKPEEQTKATFALYKERDVHPFAGFLVTLIQLPVLFALYYIFARGGFPAINTEIVYPFLHIPTAINMEFLGFVNMGASHNIVLAVLAALSQMTYTRLTMGPRGSQTPMEAVESSFSQDMAKSFDLQARYVLPLVIGVFGYFLPAVASLYWVTSNLFMIGQEYATGRRFSSLK